MNDFDYDVLQRKRLAQQAKYRKNGSKSKKCSLPSDGMSHKQWKERNGEVMSYNLNKPMNWMQFKRLSLESRKDYVKNLQDKYDAPVAWIADMFGVGRPTLAKHFDEDGIWYEHKRRNRPKAVRAAWERFLNGSADPEQEEPSSEVADEPVADVPEESLVDVKPESAKPKKPAMQLDNFSLNFKGAFNPDAIRNSLAMILEDGQEVEISISCLVL